MSVAVWQRELDRLAARIAPPRADLSALEVAARAGFTPDPWQADVLQSRADRILLNASRQSGKSTITAVLAVHQALAEPGALVLLLSPTLRQSSETFKKALSVYRALDRPVPALAETALTLALANGSRLVSLPGKESTVRGYSGVTLLVVDEAARVADDLIASVRPMLAVSAGRLVALSTPWGRRGWFWEAWRGTERWERYRIPATDCPRISPEFLEEERRVIGEFWYGQEYEVEFMDAQTSAFRTEDVEAAFGEEIALWTL